MLRSENFNHYLKESNLHENLDLTSCGTLALHWADWKKSKLLMMQLQKEFSLEKKINTLFESCELIKSQKVWIYREGEKKEISLFKLYHFIMDPMTKDALSHQDLKNLLVSCDEEFGPYYSFSRLKWYDDISFKNILYFKLLTEEELVRNFRIRTSLTCKISTTLARDLSCQLEQITNNGFLFGIDSIYEKEVLGHGNKLHLPLDFFELIGNQSFDKFTGLTFKNDCKELVNLKAIDVKLKEVRFQQCKNDISKSYVFIPFMNFEDKQLQFKLSLILNAFLNKIEDQIDDCVF